MNAEPYYTVEQSLQGDRLFVWVQETITYPRHSNSNHSDEDRTSTHRYHQHGTSNPRRYCKIVASAERYAAKRNARRAAMEAEIRKGC